MIWEIDSAHSRLSFALRFLRIGTTRGSFKTLRSHIHIDERHPANSWVEAEVEAASIDTRNRLRDAHLRSGAFFDVERYPTIVFRSTSVEQVGDQNYHVAGSLTMHGVMRPVTLHVVALEQGTSLGERAHLRASATINRNDFGIGRSVGVRLAASALVTIELELEMVQQAAEAKAQEAVAAAD